MASRSPHGTGTAADRPVEEAAVAEEGTAENRSRTGVLLGKTDANPAAEVRGGGLTNLDT